MRRLIFICFILILSGCDTVYRWMLNPQENQIYEAIKIDWHNDIPLNELNDASKICSQNLKLRGCNTVQFLLEDIAISLKSCHANMHSKLCQGIVKSVGTHPILNSLPEAEASILPENPLYWDLPTFLFESQASKYGYRLEVVFWFWQTWKIYFLSCVALLATIYIIGFGFSKYLKEKKARTELQEFEQAKQIEQRKIARIQQEQARIEAELQAKLKSEAAAAEKIMLAEKQAAERKLAEAAAALAAEQAETTSLLQAVFAQPKLKRRKHGTSPE